MWLEPGFNIYGGEKQITTKKRLKYLNEVTVADIRNNIAKVKAPFEIQQEGNVSFFSCVCNPAGELS